MKIIVRLLLIGLILLTSGIVSFAYDGPESALGIPGSAGDGPGSADDDPGSAYMGPGLYETPLYAGPYTSVVGKIGAWPTFIGPHIPTDPADYAEAGQVSVWNTRTKLHVHVDAENSDWKIATVQIYVGTDPVPVTKGGAPRWWRFPYKAKYNRHPTDTHALVLDLEEDLGFKWGQPYEELRVQNIAVHAYMYKYNENGRRIGKKHAWAYGPEEFDSHIRSSWGWWFSYEMAHPRRGHFIDSPVGGMSFSTPTNWGKTDESGGFDYFPGERVELNIGSVYLGSPYADHKISPLDIFEEADTDDPRVINMARFLQSLDSDANPKQGISVTDDVVVCLDQAVESLGLTAVDFADDAQVESVIQATIGQCEGVEGVTLAAVSAEDAKGNLDRSLSSNMFRKNISRTPDLASAKAKLNIMPVWFPALKANGDPADYGVDELGNLLLGIPYYDEEGELIRVATEAKPIVAVFTDEIEETGAPDVFAAISRDDGNTWKRKNISRAADRSSFELADGTEFYGATKKPVFQVKGNKILVAWTSKFCRGGRPRYAIKINDDPEDEHYYPYDDEYYVEDIWGVAGPQRSIDYTDEGFPEVGEVPFSCVWTARAVIVTQQMIDSQNGGSPWAEYEVGDIVWFKPERLTSGRRDANQVFMGGGSGAGFAIAWQEDPEGLRPGSGAGPGHGWGGATTNHKTDIWYSYIAWDNFGQIDANFEPGGDPEHDDAEVMGRPKALVPMSLPIRLSDNDTVNTDNMKIELDANGYPVEDGNGNWIPLPPDEEDKHAGSHSYGYVMDGLCESFYDFTNQQDVLKHVCVTADGRFLDGNTGASRPNLFLQLYTKPDGTKSAWAILGYEETKGVGLGPPDHEPGGGPYGDEYVPDVGKNVIYHSFDFQNPDLVSAGNIINLPERDEDGNLVYLVDEAGDLIYGKNGEPQLAYENARRPRFLSQPKSKVEESGTVLVTLYKEGQEGMGRQSDILMRRMVVPAGQKGNPYRFENLVCDEWATVEPVNPENAPYEVCVDGAQNVSSVTPTELWENEEAGSDNEDSHGDHIKVVRWEQTLDNLDDFSYTNPYDDARAHRGALRGDFLVIGYSWTPNWAAARNAHDKYDFYIRRSFDGGQTWTTDPNATGDVTHTDIYMNPDAIDNIYKHYEVETTYGPGEWEPARNVSLLRNNKETVIEPRIVATPGTIKDPVTGQWTGIAEDEQNTNVFYVAYGTATNVPDAHGQDDDEEELVESVPADLYYSFTQDKGQSFKIFEWVVNPDSSGNHAGDTVTGWDRLAKGDPEQGECQMRMTPDGSRFYSTWLQEGEEGSDVWLRRVMDGDFGNNVAQ